jgi:hypothetical protein
MREPKKSEKELVDPFGGRHSPTCSTPNPAGNDSTTKKLEQIRIEFWFWKRQCLKFLLIFHVTFTFQTKCHYSTRYWTHQFTWIRLTRRCLMVLSVRGWVVMSNRRKFWKEKKSKVPIFSLQTQSWFSLMRSTNVFYVLSQLNIDDSVMSMEIN